MRAALIGPLNHNTHRFGHEFLEFEFRPDGRVSGGLRADHVLDQRLEAAVFVIDIFVLHTQLRYANNSNYKNDEMITRETFCSQSILDEVKRIVEDSEVSEALRVCRP